jgi:hypothetical protein
VEVPLGLWPVSADAGGTASWVGFNIYDGSAENEFDERNLGQTMKHSAIAIVLSVLLFSTLSRADEGMSMETSWENVPRCVGRIAKNARMIIKNAPQGTKFIDATLRFGLIEMGGERVPFPETGIIPEGAIRLGEAPCNPGTYRWTIRAEDVQGHVLTAIQKDLPFP